MFLINFNIKKYDKIQFKTRQKNLRNTTINTTNI